MINHARSLLLNKPNNGTISVGSYGQEYVPPLYATVTGDTALEAAHAILFGSNPDDFTLNYRLVQYMQLLHSPATESDILALDSRYTYRFVAPIDTKLESVAIITQAEAALNLNLVGNFVGDDALGRNMINIDITAVTDNGEFSGAVLVVKNGQTIFTATSDFAGFGPTGDTDIPTVKISALPDLYLNFIWPSSPNSPAANKWHVELKARPSRTLPAIAAQLTGNASLIRGLGADFAALAPYKAAVVNTTSTLGKFNYALNLVVQRAELLRQKQL